MGKGFTLVELAIVLVIIGLLVGGVLAGQELIRVAKVNSQISQIDKFNISANTFRTKYNCTPGDCKKAEAFGLGVGAGPGKNGNGDQLVAYASGVAAPCFYFQYGTASWNSPYSYESYDFWYHLQQAELIDGSYAGYTNQTSFNASGVAQAAAPSTKIAEDGYIMPTVFTCDLLGAGYTKSNKNGFWLFGVSNSSNYPTTAILSILARMLDSKIDDGLRKTGFVVEAQSPANYFPNLCNASTCGGTNEYSTSETSKISLAITNQF